MKMVAFIFLLHNYTVCLKNNAECFIPSMSNFLIGLLLTVCNEHTFIVFANHIWNHANTAVCILIFIHLRVYSKSHSVNIDK